MTGGSSQAQSGVGHRWRFYASSSGRQPVSDFLRQLPASHRAMIVAEMEWVQKRGLHEARHLRGDIFEVRASADGNAYRILFAQEGKRGRILLALEGYSKKSPKAPTTIIQTAEQRLREWRQRGLARSRSAQARGGLE